jgi:hypothetical protein
VQLLRSWPRSTPASRPRKRSRPLGRQLAQLPIDPGWRGWSSRQTQRLLRRGHGHRGGSLDPGSRASGRSSTSRRPTRSTGGSPTRRPTSSPT